MANNGADAPILLNIPQVAALLGIGRTLAYQLVTEGKLPHVRIGRCVRIPRSAVEAWVEEHTQRSA